MCISISSWAHQGEDVAGGLWSGLSHPVTGLDHVVAMVAVGLWGAQLRSPAIWILPVVFPLIMSVGGSLGAAGVILPGIEVGIALSAIVLGILVAMAKRTSLGIAIAIIAVFAIFHGFAHGAELPHAVNALSYGAGFVIMTGLLHLSGILVGTINNSKPGKRIVQFLGVVVGLTGIYFLTQAI
jgi:urease accessory protein